MNDSLIQTLQDRLDSIEACCPICGSRIVAQSKQTLISQRIQDVQFTRFIVKCHCAKCGFLMDFEI